MTCQKIEDFLYVMAFANSAINPILYTFLGRNFKGRLLESVSTVQKSYQKSCLGRRYDLGTHMESFKVRSSYT